MTSDNKVEIIVDGVMEDPDLLEDDEHDPELHRQLVVNWGLDKAIYGILIGHGYNLQYLTQLDDRALNDVFSVSKWTGHKYALRNKLVEWPESKMFEEPSTSTPRTEVEPTQHNMLSSSVTRALLDDILARNEKGKLVCQFYQNHKTLNKECQKWLAHTIVDYYIANNKYFSLPDMDRFARLIVDKFASEIAETYYNPRSARAKKKHPSGILYDNFHNRKKPKNLKKGDTNRESESYPASEQAESVKKTANELSESEILRLSDHRQWLRNNFAPHDTLASKWRESFLLRLRLQEQNNNATIFDEWPRYLDDNGYLLIDDDFEQLFGSRGQLLTHWDSFCGRFKSYITNIKICDQVSRDLQNGILSGEYNQDYLTYAVAVVFHAVIKPTRTASNRLPSILSAQLSTCTICATEEDFEVEAAKLRELFSSNNGQLGPRVFAIGEPPVLTAFYVVADRLTFKLPSLLRSLDVAVKTTHVLNYRFPESSEILYCFFSRYFYGIDYLRKSKNIQLLKLLSYLQNKLE